MTHDDSCNPPGHLIYTVYQDIFLHKDKKYPFYVLLSWLGIHLHIGFARARHCHAFRMIQQDIKNVTNYRAMVDHFFQPLPRVHVSELDMRYRHIFGGKWDQYGVQVMGIDAQQIFISWSEHWISDWSISFWANEMYLATTLVAIDIHIFIKNNRIT